MLHLLRLRHRCEGTTRFPPMKRQRQRQRIPTQRGSPSSVSLLRPFGLHRARSPRRLLRSNGRAARRVLSKTLKMETLERSCDLGEMLAKKQRGREERGGAGTMLPADRLAKLLDVLKVRYSLVLLVLLCAPLASSAPRAIAHRFTAFRCATTSARADVVGAAGQGSVGVPRSVPCAGTLQGGVHRVHFPARVDAYADRAYRRLLSSLRPLQIH